MKRKYYFFLSNIAVPLSVGLLIYLFCYKNTYINTAVENFVGFSLPYFYYNNAFYRFLTCWACDFLWAYALTFSLFLCLKSFKSPLLLTFVISVSFSAVIELLQLFGTISGTFDIWDIFIELSAIILAVIILKIKKEFLK